MGRLTARPTTYNGIAMRSRLEARFAAWLDQKGLIWDYEPRCFANQSGQYLPDFEVYLPSGRTVYFEVRPDEAGVERAKVQQMIILSSEPGANLAIAKPGDGPTEGGWWITVRGSADIRAEWGSRH
jgi:hypothetical protein